MTGSHEPGSAPLTSPSRHDVVGVGIDAVTRQQAQDRILAAAREPMALAVSALAVHGVMSGVDDPEHRYRLSRLDLVTPDGQPVRWALNRLHGTALVERVYGPTLMRDLCRRAEAEGLAIYLYGSTDAVLARLLTALASAYPTLRIAGSSPSRFRTGTDDEADAVAAGIRASGARMCFVGLGCPRQEVFAYEMASRAGMPVIAVGAAFDFIAGTAAEAPRWMQEAGLQWLHRLARDPRRLAHRYLVLGPRYLWHVARQAAGRPVSLAPEREPARRLNYL